MNNKFKLDDTALLNLLLKQNRMTRADWARKVAKQFNLDGAKFVSTLREEQYHKLPGSDQNVYTDYKIYDTGRYLVKTTKYDRVKEIQQKAVVVTKPQVTVKKKRTFTK